MKYLSIIILILIFSFKCLVGQSLYDRLGSRGSEFLMRQNLKGRVSLDTEVKPFTRLDVAKNLISLSPAYQFFNEIEKDEYNFLVSEYYQEISSLDKTVLRDNSKRFDAFSYQDSLFAFRFNPILGYGVNSIDGVSGYERWIGAGVSFTYDDWFSGAISIRDKGEFGDLVDKEKAYSEKRGAWYKSAPKGIEYSDVIGSIGVNWSWGSLSLRKDYLQWGQGTFGQVILSDKAPSYPHVYLQLKPVSWLRFTYLHGWLNSLVPDSSQYYYSYPGTISQGLSTAYRRKYIAANFLTFTPYDRIDISLGNSAVYSGDLRPEFFIPFMFFKLLDHNTGRGEVQDANGAMFFDVSVKYPEKFHFYSSLFVDVTEIRNILKDDFRNTWSAYTLGVKGIDLLIDNFDATLEYTRINPWVYEHRDAVTTYKHINYNLGHWLGQNADQFRIQLQYKPHHKLLVQGFLEKVRKGGEADIFYAYNYRENEPNEFAFMFGKRRDEFRTGVTVSFEYMHDLLVELRYIYSDMTDQNASRYPGKVLGPAHSFSTSINYGF